LGRNRRRNEGVLRIARAPPVVGLALAAGSGATLLHLGVPLPWTLLALPPFLLLIRASRRPAFRPESLLFAFLAGAILAHLGARAEARDCRFRLREGQALAVEGRLVGPLVEGRGELRLTDPGPGGCREGIRVVVPGAGEGGIGAGALVAVGGAWRRSGGPGSHLPFRSGYLRADSVRVLPAGEPSFGDALVRMGGRVQSRLADLFPRTGAMATALVWARKEGLDPGLRDSFARAGTAHLLAISGFHVGVVAGVLLLVLASLGLPHPARFLLASAGVWAYVLAIGLPDAAFRAALILTVLAMGRLAGRSVAPLGALATAFLGFLLVDAGALARPGFQLSFAGALGLVLGYRPLSSWFRARAPRRTPAFLPAGLAAGVAATLATLPLVAWHFGRVSLVGIPLTLMVTPLVVLAIPGIFVSLLLSLAHPGLARFVAHGVELVLQLFATLVQGAAGLPMASVWVSRPAVAAGVAGLALGLVLLRLRPEMGRGGRAPFLAAAVVGALLVWPLGADLAGRGTLELVMMDVGQGDALALRSPGGRWVLVDAGPRTEAFDAGARTVLPYLRARGVRVLDLMILTHPDLDHVGGAPAVLREIPVLAVLDPGEAAGKETFLDVLEAAESRGVPWRVVGAGDSLNLHGVAVRVVGPEGQARMGDPRHAGPVDGSNDSSIVLEIRFGAFTALLTGDAPAAAELLFLPRLLSPRVQVLKVGHHGSHTSTSRELLERTRPEMALVSVGARNRYGHPHREVLDRIQEAGVRVLRTDLDGTVVIRARRDGSYRVSTER
jgi:competence protein ComEC